MLVVIDKYKIQFINQSTSKYYVKFIQKFSVWKPIKYKTVNLQNLRLNSTGDLADQSRNVFTTLFPYPGTGLSYGIANTTCRCNKHTKSQHHLCLMMCACQHKMLNNRVVPVNIKH